MIAKARSEPNLILAGLCLTAIASVWLLQAGYDHTVTHWVAVGLLSFLAWTVFRTKQRTLAVEYPLVLYGCFLLLGFASLMWSIVPHRTMVEFAQLLLYGLVFGLSWRLSPKGIALLGYSLVLVGLAIALYSLGQHLFLGLGRVYGTFVNPNPYGIFTAMLFLASWGYYLRSKRVFFGISGFVFFIALIVSGSRGSVVALCAAGVILFMGLKGSELRRAIGLTLICVILALAVADGMNFITFDRRLDDSLVRMHSLTGGSYEGRLAFWEVALRLFRSSPVLGHGLGSYSAAYFSEYDNIGWYSRFAHNHYLQVSAELGIVGLLVFGGFLFSVMYTIGRTILSRDFADYYCGLAAAGVAFLVHIGLDFSWNFPGTTLLFFTCMGVLLNRHSHRRVDTNGQGLRLSRLSILAVSVLFVLLVSWQLAAQTMFNHGIRLARQGHHEQAVGVFETANLLYPYHPQALAALSRQYFLLYGQTDNGFFAESAVYWAKQAVQASPFDTRSQFLLGRLYETLGEDDKAEEHLGIAADYAGYHISVHLELALFYLERNQLKEAEDVLLQGIELTDSALFHARTDASVAQVKEQLLSLHLLLVDTYLAWEDHEQARLHYDYARDYDPEHDLVLHFASLFDDKNDQ